MGVAGVPSLVIMLKPRSSLALLETATITDSRNSSSFYLHDLHEPQLVKGRLKAFDFDTVPRTPNCWTALRGSSVFVFDDTLALNEDEEHDMLTERMNSTPPVVATTTTGVPHLIENTSTSSNHSVISFANSDGTDSNYLIVLLPVIGLLGLISAVLTIAWLLKRNRMEKLRQHLMPMYSLEASDSGQEWEQDLLSQEVRHGTDSATTLSSPCLKFNTMHSEL